MKTELKQEIKAGDKVKVLMPDGTKKTGRVAQILRQEKPYRNLYNVEGLKCGFVTEDEILEIIGAN